MTCYNSVTPCPGPLDWHQGDGGPAQALSGPPENSTNRSGDVAASGGRDLGDLTMHQKRRPLSGPCRAQSGPHRRRDQPDRGSTLPSAAQRRNPSHLSHPVPHPDCGRGRWTGSGGSFGAPAEIAGAQAGSRWGASRLLNYPSVRLRGACGCCAGARPACVATSPVLERCCGSARAPC